MLRRNTVKSLFALALLLVSTAAANASYTVWTCYGGKWWSSATTTSYSQAQSYERAYQGYGYSTAITTGAYPSQRCGTPAQTCLYYPYVSYRGQYGYLGGYSTPGAADTAGRNWVRGVGAGANYYYPVKYCK